MADDAGAKLTPLGKILFVLLILGLVGIGGYIVYKRGLAGRTGPGAGVSESHVRVLRFSWFGALCVPPVCLIW